MTEARQRLDALRSAEQSRAHAAEALAAARADRDHASAALNADAESLPLFDPLQTEALGHALREYREARLWQARMETPVAGNGRRAASMLAATAAAGGLLALFSGSVAGNLPVMIGGLIAAAAASASAIYTHVQQRPDRRDFAGPVEEARNRLQTLRRQSGLQQLDCEDLGLERFMELLRQLDKARVEHAREAARLAEQDQRIQAMQTALRERLAPWLGIPSHDTAALQAALETLAERLADARELQTKIEESARQHERLESDLREHEAATAMLYERAALPVNDRAGLAARLETHEQFLDTRRRLDQARFAETQVRAPLADYPALLERAEQADSAEIAADIDQQVDEAAQFEPLTGEIAELRADIERTGGDGALASAIAEETALAESLAEKHVARMQASLGDWLLGEIETDYRTRHEPALIRDARDRFQRFTHHQWSFEVDAAHQPVARDLRRDTRRPLTALSSGTRMQLLLAARIAWARDQEGNGPPLPLALDEALTNTDAERFGAVASNLEALSDNEGRQILYLTARREDLLLWEQSTGHRPHCIDLGAVRGTADQATMLAPVDVPAPLPAPAGYGALEYARALQVPAIDLHAEAGSIHLFHLLRDDLDSLHVLMKQWRLTTLGPLAAWLETPAGRASHGRIGAGITLADRISIARAWHELARQGLGRPVDLGALTTAEAFTPRMLERVGEKAERLDGDADALLKALRNKAVPRLQQDHVDQLEAWLIEHGYLDRRPRLDAEAISRHLLDRLGSRMDPALIQQVSAWLAAGSTGLV